MVLGHFPMLMDNNCTSWHEDLIGCVTAEPHCYILETNKISCINYTSIKKNKNKIKKTDNNKMLTRMWRNWDLHTWLVDV